MKGHADDNIPFEELTLPQQLNIRCDEIAKIKLIDAIAEGHFIDPTFPFEDITITISNTKVRSSIKAAIDKHWGPREAKNLFSRRDKVLRSGPSPTDSAYMTHRLNALSWSACVFPVTAS